MVSQISRTRQPAISKSDNLSIILRDLTEHLCDRYTYICEDDAYLIAIWIIHTWLIAAFDKTVYLLVTSPSEDYGKSEISKSLRDLCPGAKLTIHPTASAMSKFTFNGSDVLIVDEFDRTMRRNQNEKEMLYQFADAGTDRAFDGYMLTNDLGAIEFRNVFGPKAFIGLQVPIEGTLLSRTIRISARLGTESDQEERRIRQVIRPVDKTAQSITKRIKSFVTQSVINKTRDMWAPVNIVSVRTLNNGSRLFNRNSDCWVPLIIVGDIASPEDGKRIRDIATKYTSGEIIEEPEEIITDSGQIDAAFMQLFRTGKIPVHNYMGPKDSPIRYQDNGKYRLSNNDFGWQFHGKALLNPLPAVSFMYNSDTLSAEIRIRAEHFGDIAKILGWLPKDIKRIYKEAGRLHAAKNRNTMMLAFYHKTDAVNIIGIDWSKQMFGQSDIERILNAKSEKELWAAMGDNSE